MAKKYVLIVDDDPDLVETVAMLLESKGYEVGKAYDGIEGEESIKKRRPDVLVLDVMMPRKDGYKLCKELKSNKWTQDIPVILLTAVGEAVSTTTYTHAEGCPPKPRISSPSRWTPRPWWRRWSGSCSRRHAIQQRATSLFRGRITLSCPGKGFFNQARGCPRTGRQERSLWARRKTIRSPGWGG
jgi:two-component system, OmpR family, alkaline phosphatase synthesis response regulator PhoP